jgi:hypothetical protein
VKKDSSLYETQGKNRFYLWMFLASIGRLDVISKEKGSSVYVEMAVRRFDLYKG